MVRRFSLRVDVGIGRRVDVLARDAGVSINSLISGALAGAIDELDRYFERRAEVARMADPEKQLGLAEVGVMRRVLREVWPAKLVDHGLTRAEREWERK